MPHLSLHEPWSTILGQGSLGRDGASGACPRWRCIGWGTVEGGGNIPSCVDIMGHGGDTNRLLVAGGGVKTL